MTKLISLYASAAGLLIDKPEIAEHFYPHPFEQYVTVQTGSAQGAKCYSFWQEVIAMLKPILDANKIAILLLGGKDDPALNGVHDLRGKTSYLQSHYLIKRTLCHMGNDSWLAHAAGWNYRPLVALYGSTDPGPHGPYWYDVAKTTLLVSHRNGGLPSFVQQESPKTVDLIPPEQVANAVLRHLGVTEGLFTYSTRYVGPLYSAAVLELVPNAVPAPTFCPEMPITVRMDIHFSENNLVGTLQTGRKVHIVTKRALNVGLLQQFRGQILTYSHEIIPGVEEPPVPYADLVRSLFPTSHAFFTRATDPKVLGDLRFTYLDHVTVSVHRDLTKEDYVKATLGYLNRPDTPENRLDIEGQLAHTRFKSNRYTLSNGAIFMSHAHLAANKPAASLADNTAEVLDSPPFWESLNHYLITYHP